mgnify:CR=1
EVRDEVIQESINQNTRWIKENDLFVSKPEFFLIQLILVLVGRSLYIFKCQKAYEKKLSEDYKLHQKVANSIMPFMV